MRETRSSRRARITRCRSSRVARRGWSGRRFCESRFWPAQDCCPCRRSGRSMRRSSAKLERDGYTIEKVLMETLPGFYLGGNLYRPLGKQGPFPGVVSPHGHWDYGRLENTALVSVPGRAHHSGQAGIRRLLLRHDRLERHQPGSASLGRAALRFVGHRPDGNTAVEQHPGHRFRQFASRCRSRADRRHRRFRRRHPDIFPDGGGRTD